MPLVGAARAQPARIESIPSRTATVVKVLRIVAVAAIPGGGPRVVEIKKGVFSRYPKKETGSWQESDRGGTRLCEKVHNIVVEWKICLDVMG